jgi:hypothetical protein
MRDAFPIVCTEPVQKQVPFIPLITFYMLCFSLQQEFQSQNTTESLIFTYLS